MSHALTENVILKNLKRILAIGFLLALVKVWVLIEPMQSPDEFLHLFRAQALASGRWILEPEDSSGKVSIFAKGRQAGARIDEGWIAYKQAHVPLILDPDLQLSAEDGQYIKGLERTGHARYQALPGAGFYFPMVYVPHAVALALAEWMDLRIHQSYWLARIFSAFTCGALLVMAWHVRKPPVLAVGLLLLPMTVFQFLSPTIDGITTAAAVLALSLFMALHDQRSPPGLRDSSALAFLVFILATSRTHLLPLLALPLWLWWKFPNRSHAALCVLTSVATLAWIAFALGTSVDDRVYKSMDHGSWLMYYMTHPNEYLQKIWTTVSDPTVLTFYAQSFVGILGWLNIALPTWAYPAIGCSLGLLAIFSVDLRLQNNGTPLLQGPLLMVLAVVSCALVFLAMLVSWTPAGTMRIEGVQGRYFMVPALMMAYGLGASRVDTAGWREKWRPVLLVCMGALCLVALNSALSARYH